MGNTAVRQIDGCSAEVNRAIIYVYVRFTTVTLYSVLVLGGGGTGIVLVSGVDGNDISGLFKVLGFFLIVL